MIGKRQKTPVKPSVLANKNRINHGLEIIVDHALRHTAKECERQIVSIQNHFLSFARIGHHKHLPAVGKTEMRDLYRLNHTAEFNLLLAPVKLADLARTKYQRHKSLRNRRL